MPRLLPLLCALAIAAGLMALARPASAQTVSWSTGQTFPTRNVAVREQGFEPQGISYSDCTADIELRFNVVYASLVAGQQVQIWAGTDDCKVKDNRQLRNTCWKIGDSLNGPRPSNSDSLVVTAKEIVGPFNDTARPIGANGRDYRERGNEICNRTDFAATTVTVYILVLTSSNENIEGATPLTYPVRIDTLAPNGPAVSGVGLGDGLLKIGLGGLDTSQISDVAYYKLYCAPVTGDGGACAAPTSADGGATMPVCNARVEKGTSEATVFNLVNGTQYAFAYSAVDLFLNEGKQGAVSCGSPVPVDDFWKRYRGAGGQAGGGFCSASFGTAGASMFGIGVALAGLAWVRRRRSK
jgi:hypothetical protein